MRSPRARRNIYSPKTPPAFPVLPCGRATRARGGEMPVETEKERGQAAPQGAGHAAPEAAAPDKTAAVAWTSYVRGLQVQREAAGQQPPNTAPWEDEVHGV